MRYEIDNKNVIRVFKDGEDVPFTLQPDWPDTTPWANAKEARDWAELLVESTENPNSEFIPGTSPANHPKPRPKQLNVEENQAKLESAKAKLTALGLDEAEVQAILGL